MLPYLYLVISGMCITAMSLLRKEYDNRTTGIRASFTFIVYVSGIMLLACLGILAVGGNLPNLLAIDGLTLLLGASYAMVTFLATIICIVGASYGSVSLLVTFANLGIVTLSTVYGLLFDAENNKPSLYTWLGLVTVFAVLAITFFTKEKGAGQAQSAKDKRIYKLLCVGIFFINGLALILYSLETTHRPAVRSFSFVALYCSFCVLFALIGLAFSLPRGKGAVGPKKPFLTPAIGLILVGYAATLLASEILALTNTTLIPIIIQAPLSFAIPAIILTTSEALIYKMPITKSLIAQLVLSLIGTILFVL